MANNILVPDIGDFEKVEIIEILVKTGDNIKKNDSVVTLESDKSSVEVPSIYEGIVESVDVKIGDKVSKGDLLITLSGEKKSEDIIFTISAKSFLHSQVRIMVGTLVDIGKGLLLKSVSEIIESKNRVLAGQTAPSSGLYLKKIDY